jgi:hypothetical protein
VLEPAGGSEDELAVEVESHEVGKPGGLDLDPDREPGRVAAAEGERDRAAVDLHAPRRRRDRDRLRRTGAEVPLELGVDRAGARAEELFELVEEAGVVDRERTRRLPVARDERARELLGQLVVQRPGDPPGERAAVVRALGEQAPEEPAGGEEVVSGVLQRPAEDVAAAAEAAHPVRVAEALVEVPGKEAPAAAGDPAPAVAYHGGLEEVAGCAVERGEERLLERVEIEARRGALGRERRGERVDPGEQIGARRRGARARLDLGAHEVVLAVAGAALEVVLSDPLEEDVDRARAAVHREARRARERGVGAEPARDVVGEGVEEHPAHAVARGAGVGVGDEVLDRAREAARQALRRERARAERGAEDEPEAARPPAAAVAAVDPEAGGRGEAERAALEPGEPGDLLPRRAARERVRVEPREAARLDPDRDERGFREARRCRREPAARHRLGRERARGERRARAGVEVVRRMEREPLGPDERRAQLRRAERARRGGRTRERGGVLLAEARGAEREGERSARERGGRGAPPRAPARRVHGSGWSAPKTIDRLSGAARSRRSRSSAGASSGRTPRKRQVTVTRPSSAIRLSSAPRLPPAASAARSSPPRAA